MYYSPFYLVYDHNTAYEDCFPHCQSRQEYEQPPNPHHLLQQAHGAYDPNAFPPFGYGFDNTGFAMNYSWLYGRSGWTLQARSYSDDMTARSPFPYDYDSPWIINKWFSARTSFEFFTLKYTSVLFLIWCSKRRSNKENIDAKKSLLSPPLSGLLMSIFILFFQSRTGLLYSRHRSHMISSITVSVVSTPLFFFFLSKKNSSDFGALFWFKKIVFIVLFLFLSSLLLHCYIFFIIAASLLFRDTFESRSVSCFGITTQHPNCITKTKNTSHDFISLFGKSGALFFSNT